MNSSPMVTLTERPTSPSIHDKRRDQLDRPTISKRLTLNFPVLQPITLPEQLVFPSPSHTAPVETVRISPRLPTIAASPTESSTFLTYLAAQERRVLELREELHKAEVDLSNLKKQWAVYEAGRKKDELRRVGKLQNLPVNNSAAVDGLIENGAQPAAALRASLENGTERPVIRKSTQRIFSGSRHTRALSLLSPGAMNHVSSQSRQSQAVLSPTLTTTDIHSSQSPLSRSSTVTMSEQNIAFGRTYKQLAERRSMPGPTKDVILNGGRKMASDLREGLWTFFEDIRQATVGEEGIHGTGTRVSGSGKAQIHGGRRLQISEQERKEARTTVKQRTEGQKVNASKMTRREMETTSADPETSFWREFGLETPSKKTIDPVSVGRKRSPEAEVSLTDVGKSWDIWDSPVPPQDSYKHSDSGKAKYGGDGDGIRWPELRKLTPKLSRTMSDLVKEWDNPAVTGTSPAGLEHRAVASPYI